MVYLIYFYRICYLKGKKGNENDLFLKIFVYDFYLINFVLVC